MTKHEFIDTYIEKFNDGLEATVTGHQEIIDGALARSKRWGRAALFFAAYGVTLAFLGFFYAVGETMLAVAILGSLGCGAIASIERGHGLTVLGAMTDNMVLHQVRCIGVSRKPRTPSWHKPKCPFNRALDPIRQLTEYAAVMGIDFGEAMQRSQYAAPGTTHRAPQFASNGMRILTKAKKRLIIGGGVSPYAHGRSR